MSARGGRRHFQDGLIYRMCWATGVFPVYRHPHLDLHSGGVESGTDCFSPSPWGCVVTVIQLTVITLFAYSTAPSQSNLFTYYGSLWIQCFSSSILTLLLALLRPRSIATCLSIACRISSTSLDPRPLPLSLFSFLVIYPFISFFTTTFFIVFVSSDGAFLLLMFTYAYIQPAVVEVVFCSLCIIVAEGHSEINEFLSGVLSVRFKHASFVNHLNYYIFLLKFVRTMNKFFGIHLLNGFISFTFLMVSYAVVFIMLIRVRSYLGVFTYFLHTSYSFVRVFMVCRSCQRIQDKANETISILRRLRIMCVQQMTKEQSNILDIYEELMSSTKVEFTACGLFLINMTQVLTVLGLIMTYGLVAVQSHWITS